MPPKNCSCRRTAATPIPRRAKQAFTLAEVTIVVTLLAVIAAVFVPFFGASTSEQLYAAAHVVASDLQYCRDLAVTHHSDYQVRFDFSSNRYEVSHQGDNASLDSLPPSSFLMTTVGAGGKTIQYNALEQQAGEECVVQLFAVTRDGHSSHPAIRFTSLGSVATEAPTRIWLTAKAGNQQKYVSIDIDATTGDIRIGAVTDDPP